MKKPCPRCGKINEAKYATWHPECVHLYKMEHWPSYVADEAWRTKPHVCVRCWINLDLMTEAYDRYIEQYKGPGDRPGHHWSNAGYNAAWDLMVKYGFKRRSSFWEANHIVARHEGGGTLGLDNIEIVCVPCHKDITTEQRRRWAKERRSA